MTSLNHTLPASWGSQTPAEVVQLLALYVPAVSGSHIRSLSANTTISLLANLYIDTNGTASSSQVAELLGTTVGQFEELSGVVGQTKNSSLNAQSFQQTILWGNLVFPQLPVYPPEVGYLALGIIFISISIITTILRLYQRARAPTGLKLVDYTLCMALVIAITMQGLFGSFVEILVLRGTGAIWDITFDTFIRLQILAAILGVIYHACIFFIKSSILIFYAQMSSVTYHLWIIYFVLAICVSSNIIGFFATLFQYRPVDFWNHELNPNPWPPRDKVLFAVGIVNIITDVLIWVMPIPAIIELGRTWWARIIAMGIIFSSAAACVFSILRVRKVWLGGLATETGKLSDFTITTFSMLEINLAIITYNIPAIRVLYTTYMRQKRQRVQQNSFHLEREVGDFATKMRRVGSFSNPGSIEAKSSDVTVNKESRGNTGNTEIA